MGYLVWPMLTELQLEQVMLLASKTSSPGCYIQVHVVNKPLSSTSLLLVPFVLNVSILQASTYNMYNLM